MTIIRWRPFFLRPAYCFAIASAFAIMFSLQSYRSFRIEHFPAYYPDHLAAWLVQCFLWTLVALFLWQFIPYFPIAKPTWRRDISFHIVFGTVINVVELLLYVSIAHLFRVGAPSGVDFAEHLHFNLNADLANNLFIYVFLLALFRAVDFSQKVRERELEAAQLEIKLNEARLQLLRSQLNPHFLFNALNSVSGLMQTDIDAADEMLERLAHLLRMALAEKENEVTLQKELEFAREYLAIQIVRFRDQMQVSYNINPNVLGALVPSMVLQPLLENAVLHGVSQMTRLGTVDIAANKQDGSLHIAIRNDSPGVRSVGSGCGLGLQNTRDRLAVLYKDSYHFSIADLPRGQVEVKISIPLRYSSQQIEDEAPSRIAVRH